MGAVRVSFGEGISSQPESGPSQVMSGTPLRSRSFRRGGNTAHIGESPTGEATARVWARLLPRERDSPIDGAFRVAGGKTDVAAPPR